MSIRTPSSARTFLGWGGWLLIAGCSSDPQQSEDSTQPSSSNDTDERSSDSRTSGTSGSPSATTSSPNEHTDTSDATTPNSMLPTVELMWDNLTYPCSLRDFGDSILTCDRRQYLGEQSLVLSLPKGGGTPTTLSELPAADAVAATEAIWVLDGQDQRITRFAPDTPGTRDTLQAAYYTSGLFSAGTGVLATSYEGLGWYPDGSGSGSSLWTAGDEEEVWLLATTSSTVYFTLNPPYPAPRGSGYKVLALNVDFATGTALGAPTELDSGIGSAKGIAVTADAVIFADNHNDKLYSVPLGGGTRTLLAELPYPWSVGVNSTHAYVASRPETCTSEGAVYRVPLAGGQLETIAASQVCPSNVLVSDSEVYWLNAGREQPDGEPVMVSGSYASIMRAAL